jgi:hypothetical protein
MSVERVPRAARALIAVALLAVPLLAAAQKGETKQEDAFDFEAAGGAAAAGLMHRAGVTLIAGYCSEKLPDSAGPWRDVAAEWDRRNAPWMTAGERVLEVAMRKLREQNEDADAVRGMLDTMVDEFAGRTLDEVRKQADASSVAEVCDSMRTGIDAGKFDVSTNGYTRAIDLLRTYLPTTETEQPAR